ncbi:MAG: response regulator [Deltaproteobacteria bacterium]|nr:response regulator [Deltaproteobacteria bacterium]
MSEHIIMLVEDNQDDIDLTMRAFARNNIMNEIVIARDGIEALDYLFATGAHLGRDLRVMPEVILLDLKMPRMGGIEVLRYIRSDARTKLLPVVVLTSSDEERDIVESYECGVNSYIRKPVDFNQFVDAVRQLSLYWIVLNKCPRIPAP